MLTAPLTLNCTTLNGHAYTHTFDYPDARKDYARLITLCEPYGEPEWGEDEEGLLLARLNGLPDGHACHAVIDRWGAAVVYQLTYTTMRGQEDKEIIGADAAAQWLAQRVAE